MSTTEVLENGGPLTRGPNSIVASQRSDVSHKAPPSRGPPRKLHPSSPLVPASLRLSPIAAATAASPEEKAESVAASKVAVEGLTMARILENGGPLTRGPNSIDPSVADVSRKPPLSLDGPPRWHLRQTNKVETPTAPGAPLPIVPEPVVSTAIARVLENGGPLTRGPNSIDPSVADVSRKPPLSLDGPPRYLRQQGVLPSPVPDKSPIQEPEIVVNDDGDDDASVHQEAEAADDDVPQALSEKVASAKNSPDDHEAGDGEGGDDMTSTAAMTHTSPSRACGGGGSISARSSPQPTPREAAVAHGAAHPNTNTTADSTRRASHVPTTAVPSTQPPQLRPAAPGEHPYAVAMNCQSEHDPQQHASAGAGAGAGAGGPSTCPAPHVVSAANTHPYAYTSPSSGGGYQAASQGPQSQLPPPPPWGTGVVGKTTDLDGLDLFEPVLCGVRVEPDDEALLHTPLRRDQSQSLAEMLYSALQTPTSIPLRNGLDGGRSTPLSRCSSSGDDGQRAVSSTPEAQTEGFTLIPVVVPAGVAGAEACVVRVYVTTALLERTTVEEVKIEVERQLRIPLEQFELRCEGELLDNAFSMHLLDQDAVLFLSLRQAAAAAATETDVEEGEMGMGMAGGGGVGSRPEMGLFSPMEAADVGPGADTNSFRETTGARKASPPSLAIHSAASAGRLGDAGGVKPLESNGGAGQATGRRGRNTTTRMTATALTPVAQRLESTIMDHVQRMERLLAGQPPVATSPYHFTAPFAGTPPLRSSGTAWGPLTSSPYGDVPGIAAATGGYSVAALPSHSNYYSTEHTSLPYGTQEEGRPWHVPLREDSTGDGPLFGASPEDRAQTLTDGEETGEADPEAAAVFAVNGGVDYHAFENMLQQGGGGGGDMMLGRGRGDVAAGGVQPISFEPSGSAGRTEW